MASTRDRIKGSITALITPFKDGKVDEAAFRKLVNWQIEQGTNGLVPCGTTGESPTLSHDEHARVIELCVEEAKGRVPVIAGAGSNSTEEAIMRTRHAKEVGCDAVLHVTGYYNKPTQEGLFQHYKALAEAVPLPIVVYSVQGRTGVNVEPATLARLATIKNIVGVKEASGNIAQMANVLHEVPSDFKVLSGDDSITIALMGLGGHGLISVASNEIPAEMTTITRLCRNGDYAGARKIQREFLPLMNINFIESNPGPVKAAMAMMGLCQPVWRLPMVPPSAANESKIRAVLVQSGLLKEQAQHASR